MMNDMERLFNRLYRTSSQEADSLAQEGIKELYLGCSGELALNPAERLLNIFRFQTITDMLKINGLVMLILMAATLVAAFFRPMLGIWSEVIYATSIGITGTFILAYITVSVCLENRAWSTVSSMQRRDINATLIIEKWVAHRQNIDDLMPSFKASLDTFKKFQEFVKGWVFAAGAFLTFFKLLFSERVSLQETVLAFLALSSSFGLYLYVGVFFVALLAVFVFISVPISWRESLEPHLVRAIEKYKKQHQDE
jgi:hypothetical protein